MNNRISVDITPASVSLSEDILKKISAQHVGKPYKNASGELVGEIRKVEVKNGHLIAEVLLTPGVILG